MKHEVQRAVTPEIYMVLTRERERDERCFDCEIRG